MRDGFISIKGNNIWYSVYGEDKKAVPLLIVHGGPGFLSMPQVVNEFASDRPVYFYDQLGCGKSAQASDKSFYTGEYYVNELSEVRHKLGLDSVYLMGFSWGTALICSYLLDKNPAGVQGLILCGPLLSTARWYTDQRENIALLPESIRQAIEDGERKADYGEQYQAAMLAYYRKHVCRLESWPDFLNEALAKLNMDVYLTLWGPSEFTVTGTLRDLDLIPELHRIKQPVLLVCGDRDEAGVKTVKDYQMAFPDAAMAVIPQASHLHQLEQPDIFKVIVNRFLEKL
jgi:proline iminopeptidase